MHVGPRRFIVGVPLLVFDLKRGAEAIHDRMRRCFHINLAGGKGWDVLGEANATHKGGKPGPDRIPVELAQECRMMEADPSSAALLDVLLERRHSRWLPRIRRVIQLNE